MKKIRTVSILLILLTLLLSACRGSDPGRIAALPSWDDPAEMLPIELIEGEKLKVVATTSIVGDVVSFIGGNEIDLTVLMPFSIDPHAYEATPGDLRSLEDADVVFINGLGLEISLHDYLQPLLESVPIVSLSQGIPARNFSEGDDNQDDHGAEDGEQQDPHVWFDPANVKHWVDRVEIALSKLNPAKRSRFSEHAETYRIFVDNLDEWIEEMVGQVPSDRRVLVSDHYVFGYFAERYGFEMVGAVIPVYSSAAEPSAQEIANLNETIANSGVKVIFVGEALNSAVAASIADDTGVSLVRLYTGSLSDADGPASSYLNFMQYNVNQIVNALLE